jgi:hypothetical protein
LITLSCEDGSGVSDVGADDLVPVDEDVDEGGAAAGCVDVRVSESLLYLFEDFGDGLCELRAFDLMFVNFGHVLDDELRDEVSEDAVPVGDGVEVGGAFCEVGLDEEAVLVDLVGVVDLHALPGAVGVALLHPPLLPRLLRSHCRREVRGRPLPLLQVDRRAAVVPRLVVQRLVGRPRLLGRLAEEGVGGVALDRQLRPVVLIEVVRLGGQRGLAAALRLQGRFLSRLAAQVLLVVKGHPFGVELHRPLDIFDWRFGPAVPRLVLFVERRIALAPLDEVLPESRVFQLLPQLFRPHQVVLQLLHILNIINDNIKLGNPEPPQ